MTVKGLEKESEKTPIFQTEQRSLNKFFVCVSCCLFTVYLLRSQVKC
jgi:hypothetical protein